MAYRRFRRPIAVVTPLIAGALIVPASALASTVSGGGGLGSVTSPLGTPTTIAQPGDLAVSAAGAGLSLDTLSSSMLRGSLAFTGSSTAAAGTEIEIERSGRETDWAWAPTVATTVQSGGTFSASWTTDHIGQFAVRAVEITSGLSQGSDATASLTTTVYRPSKATLYGPGFYGRRTACGQRLTPDTIGLANRTLKCGESVALYFHGRTLEVPVIDRGPYANGADWDLTMATGRALGMAGTEQIGAVSLPRAPVTAAAHRG